MFTPQTLASLLERIAGTRVLVLGDAIADQYLEGHIDRISREAPVLILRHRKTRLVPGGAANAAANIAALAGKVEMVGVVGRDGPGNVMKDTLERLGVGTTGLVGDPMRPTVSKMRVTATSNQSVTQQIVRIDQQSDEPLSDVIEHEVLAAYSRLLPTVDAVLLSEYGNGVLSPAIRGQALTMAQSIGVPVVVDAQGPLDPFKGVAALTPNQPEAEAVVGFAITDEGSLQRAGDRLLAMTDAEAVLITRGAMGIALFERGHPRVDIPAFNRSEVFDVTGAGDTVVGTLTLARAAGAPWRDATILANLAASQVVRRFGTSTTSPAEMLAAIGWAEGLEDLA
ncbi:MAG: PfkB family carbohydrate kinase [Candidatus Sericytochromatia bacterium]|nr:PfkB family carbohydrate kinase [Candidatus Sericytochromatia bacterium]